MNAGEIVITAVGAIGGVGGAVFAWVQAKAAVDSRDDARNAQSEAESAQKRAEEARDEALDLSRKATAAAERQAVALEVANKLLAESHDLSRRTAPPVWSQARQVADAYVLFDNTSGRHIIVTSLLVEPDEYGALMKAAPRPHRVENGDAFAVAWERRFSLPGPRKVTIIWRYEDGTETSETERSL